MKSKREVKELLELRLFELDAALEKPMKDEIKKLIVLRLEQTVFDLCWVLEIPYKDTL